MASDSNCDCQFYKIGTGSRGRGLFATKAIPPFTLIHTAPCILVRQSEYDKHMKHTILEHYLFNCSNREDRLLALGHGSLFNHDSKTPNVDYRLEENSLLINYYTSHRGAKTGEELCIYYGDDLWFKDGNDDGSDESSSSTSDTDEKGITAFLSRIEL